MLYSILIICLFEFSKIAIGINICKTNDKCHDGGCNFINSDDTNERCVCSLSNGVMDGKFCGLYIDMCLKNPCKNQGKCKSGIGHHICECSNGFYGINCEYIIKTSKINI